MRYGGMLPGRGGIPDQRGQTAALQSGRSSAKTAQIRQCGVEVEQFDGARTAAAGGADSGAPDQQRNARGCFEVGLLHPLAMLAQMVPVVAPKDDEGVLPQAEAVESCQQPADLRVHETDRRIVGADGFAPLADVHAQVCGGG